MNPIALVVQLLGESLEVPVSTEVPPQRPERMVIVSLEGDRSDELILRPSVSLMCVGTSDLDAFELSTDAVTALRESAQTHPYLSSVQLNGKAGDRLDRTGEGIYQSLLELTINTDE